jgi:hypothetical protein
MDYLYVLCIILMVLSCVLYMTLMVFIYVYYRLFACTNLVDVMSLFFIFFCSIYRFSTKIVWFLKKKIPPEITTAIFRKNRPIYRWNQPHFSLPNRDDNLGTGTRYLPGTRPDGYGYGGDFLSVDDIRTRPESRWVRNGYFFPLAGNPTGTRYFTAAIILRCEQVKMCSFCYINYGLFWLLNFTTQLSKIFVKY